MATTEIAINLSAQTQPQMQNKARCLGRGDVITGTCNEWDISETGSLCLYLTETTSESCSWETRDPLIPSVQPCDRELLSQKTEKRKNQLYLSQPSYRMRKLFTLIWKYLPNMQGFSQVSTPNTFPFSWFRHFFHLSFIHPFCWECLLPSQRQTLFCTVFPTPKICSGFPWNPCWAEALHIPYICLCNAFHCFFCAGCWRAA